MDVCNQERLTYSTVAVLGSNGFAIPMSRWFNQLCTQPQHPFSDIYRGLLREINSGVIRTQYSGGCARVM